MEGKKFDDGKDPWQLLPWDAVRCVVKVLAFGANKYSERNWEKGMNYDRLFRAAIEHLTEWFQTGKPDPETGFSHLWHAGCCVLFLIAYELRGAGRDNRPCRIGHTSEAPGSPDAVELTPAEENALFARFMATGRIPPR